MVNLYDIAYGLGLALAAPFWLIRRTARVKVFAAISQRMGSVPRRASTAPAVMIHAVSLGEMNATRGLVDRLRQHRPDLHLIISATTDTGFARAQELYGVAASSTAVTLVRYPLDFTWAVARVLDNLRPSVVVLMELEIWPNFLHHCDRRSIPVILVNGRMTAPSFRRYRLVRPIVARMLRHMAALCVQDQTNAGRFAALGSPADRIHITGTMKFDTATVAERVAGDDELAAAVGLKPGQEPIWVCGSTGPGEEQIIIAQYRHLLARYPALRLIIVPRHPQRFDEVAALITSAGLPLIRRSQPTLTRDPSPQAPVVLGDTMGELRKFYSLATVVFVGRTLVDLGPRQHGSDMIEPAALGKPVIVGPFTANFADAIARFRQASAIVEVDTPGALGQGVTRLLSFPQDAANIARAAQQVVLNEKGATERHAQLILARLPPNT